MKPHHVRVHALGVNRVAANLAKHRAARICERLLDEWLSSWPSATPALILRPGAFRPFPTTRRGSATAAIPRIETSFRIHNLPCILAGRLR
jgi:hypothetical protein